MSLAHGFGPAYYARLPLALAQGLWLKWRAPRFAEAAGARTGRSDIRVYLGRPLRFLALGDSVIAGVGIAQLENAMALQCASAIAERLQRPVAWSVHGENGARAVQVLERCPELSELAPDIILISVGVNNVTSMQSPRSWHHELLALAQHLQQGAPGAIQIYIGVPPMAQFPLLPRTLRRVLGERATRFDEIMGSTLANLPQTLHFPIRHAAPEQLSFAADGYHPSEQSCRVFAAHLAEFLATQQSVAIPT